MGFMDNILKKLKLTEEAEDQEYDDYDDYQEEEEEKVTKKAPKKEAKKSSYDYDDYDDDEDDVYANPGKKFEPARTPSYTKPQAPAKVVGTTRGAGSNATVCMIIPKSFDDANSIADKLLENKAVLLNLEGIDMAAAQRIIDFASGACYTVGGSLQKVSKKIFVIVPESMSLAGDFDSVIGDMIDLNSVNMLK